MNPDSDSHHSRSDLRPKDSAAAEAQIHKNELGKAHKPIDEHLMPLDAVSSRYSVHVNEKNPPQSEGLHDDAVKERLETYGPNMMTPPKEHPLFYVYLLCLSNLFNALLIVSGVLSLIIFAIPPGGIVNVYVAVVLFAVATLNALIEFIQEIKTKSLLKSFMDLVPRNCMVIRNSLVKTVPAADLVPGDVVICRMGDKMPADVRVFSAVDFKVDNSSLTGESDPQERWSSNENQNPLEATNLAFNGSLVVSGEAYGIVIRTGDATVLGQIANLAGSEEKRDSPLSIEIDFFVKFISGVAVIVAFVFFGVGWRRIIASSDSERLGLDFQFAIGMFVSFVPEGLPATVTTLLSIAAKRMSKRNVLVKDLRGVETLGAITCLATDKTGTLTRNQMTVTLVWGGSEIYDTLGHSSTDDKDKAVLEIGYSKKGDFIAEMPAIAPKEKYKQFDYNIPELMTITNIAYLCSKAKFDRLDVPIKQRSIIADATETGLFQFAAMSIPESDKIRDTYPKIFEIPFNSSNKWALTVHQMKHSSGLYTLFIKGAPERVWKLCSRIAAGEGKIEEISDNHKDAFNRAYEVMASKGHRVIGFAKLDLPEDSYPDGFQFVKDEKDLEKLKGQKGGIYPKNGYTFCGLVSLEDPPKHGVREAIGICRQAGIKVMMVTGDHPLTAEAIGRKINLMIQETKEMVAKRTNRSINAVEEHEYNAIVIHGEKIDTLTEDEWENILNKEEIIFARTSPKHKLQIVKRCQARGHIVGVTGDGVNDSPALKKADLGIAMNISGSDVSKEAAGMILLDDNFASTVSGISEGRLIFQNLKKSVRYTISHTMPEVMANLLYIVVPLPLPMASLQIIVVDLGFELFIALSYAFEGPENPSALMTQLPRKPVNLKSIDLGLREKSYSERKTKEIKRIIYGTSSGEQDGDNQSIIPKDASLLMKVKLFYALVYHFITHINDKEGWSLFFEPREQDVLVDKEVLSYAYLEIGMLETIGCFLAYFHVWYDHKADFQFKNLTDIANSANDANLQLDDHYQEVLRMSQSAFYFGIAIQQIFNHFLCKGSRRVPFGLFVLRNFYSLAGIAAGVAFACFIVYPPFMKVVFNTQPLNPKYWGFPLAMGCFILFYGSLRVLISRNFVSKNPNMALPLDLHPTRWSTSSRA